MNELPDCVALDRLQHAERNAELLGAEQEQEKLSPENEKAMKTLSRWAKAVAQMGELPDGSDLVSEC